MSWPPLFCHTTDCPSHMYCNKDYGNPNYEKSAPALTYPYPNSACCCCAAYISSLIQCCLYLIQCCLSLCAPCTATVLADPAGFSVRGLYHPPDTGSQLLPLAALIDCAAHTTLCIPLTRPCACRSHAHVHAALTPMCMPLSRPCACRSHAPVQLSLIVPLTQPCA